MTQYALSDAMARFVSATEAFAGNDPSMLAQRQSYRRMCAAFTPPRPARLQVSDLRLAEVPVRRYLPAAPQPAGGWPWVLYLHGGGWTVGGLESHDFICCELAKTLQASVFAVDYRLAPEHPFPAAFDDCVAVWQALLADPSLHAGGGVVMGDSAGGNLAAAMCLALRDRHLPIPAAQVLIYPALGGAADSPSRQMCSDAPLLSADEVLECLQCYVPAEHRSDPLALPLLSSDLGGLPPAFIAVAQYDPLHDDGLEYHLRLLAAGVKSRFYPGQGLVHGCLRGRGRVPEVDDLYAVVLSYLRMALRP